jgi:hypothetical protein
MLKELIEPYAGRALALKLDITRAAKIDAAVKLALEKFGA